MEINLSIEAPDRPRHECLVVGLFGDEKPPRGIGGLIDWRLNGLISREIRFARISGAPEERVLIPNPDRIGARLLLLFGMGYLPDLNYDRIYQAAHHIAGAIMGLKLTEFSFDLPGYGRSALSGSGIIEAMMTGIFDRLSEDVQKLHVMKALMVAPPQVVPDLAVGVDRFNKNVRHLGSVDFSPLDAYLSKRTDPFSE